jgi:hypothetical protein
MNRKAPWTTAFPEQVKRTPKLSKPTKRRKPVRQVSKRRATAMVEYRREVVLYLIAQRKINWRCPVFPHQVATEIHHKRGRVGNLLLDKRHWLAVSRDGHNWIHAHPTEARMRGWLCAPGDWNRPDEAP